MSFIKSMTDIKFYRQIINQSVWKSILYMLILSIIVYTVGMSAFIIKADYIMQDQALPFVNQLPDFKIENGQLDINVPQPFKYSSDGNVVVIDTINDIDPNLYTDTRSAVILGKDSITTINATKIETVKYSTIMKSLNIESINKDTIVKNVPKFNQAVKKYLIIFAVFFYGIWFGAFKIWSVIILSMVVMIVDNSKGTRLTYKNMFNISVYAITLSWIIKMFYQLLDLQFPMHWPLFQIIYWAVAVIYVIEVIKDIKNNMPKEEEKEEIEVLVPTPPEELK